jgi:opacity protein-like surface antigen
MLPTNNVILRQEFSMKKTLSLGFATLATAAHLSAAPQISSGAYAGAAAGVSVLGGKNQLAISNDAAVAGQQVLQDQGNFSLSKTSPAVMIFAGYGMKVSGFWTAAELFYQFDSLKDKQNPVFAGTTPKNLSSTSTGAYGLSAHLGFLPSENCTAYVILGVEARRFKVKFSDPTPANVSAAINKGYTSVAFVPGIGARFALTKELSLRTEYKYAMHRSKTLNASAKNTANAAQTDTVKIKHQPKVHSFNVGVVYSF